MQVLPHLKFSVHGAEPLKVKLDAADALLYGGARRACEASARRIVGRARALVRVASGTLRDSINYEMVGSVGHVGLTLSEALNYWYLVEFGTVHSAPHPYFRPAAEGDKGAFVRDMGAVTNALTRL